MAILGTKSSILPIELAGKITEKAKSVCMITGSYGEDSAQKTGGTGFLISKRFVITTDHVVDFLKDRGFEIDINFSFTLESENNEPAFVDTAPFPWDNPMANKLYKALSNAYTNDAYRLQILALAGIPRAHLLQSGPPFETWMQALNVAANLGKIKELIAQVLSDDKAKGYHQDIRDSCVKPKKTTAKVTKIDSDKGFALLELNQESGLSPLTFGDSHKLLPSEGIVIVHHPQLKSKSFGLEPDGVIKVDQETIFHSLDTMGGSSGAPLFNDKMEVIGIHRGSNRDNNKGAFDNYGMSIDFLKSSLDDLEIDYLSTNS